jgi:cation transport regulator
LEVLYLPYESIDDLPKGVKDNLPKHALEIFKEAFNRALDEYKEPEDRKDNASREETAFKVSWAAVKQTYHKNNTGHWIPNTD